MSDPNLKPSHLLRYFFPAEILKSLHLTPNGCTIPDIRRKLYMNSNGIIDNLAKFKSFPGSDNKFEIGMTVPYNMDTYVYSSMTDADKTFAYKHDFLIFLGQIVSEKVKHSPLFMSLITFYLKNKERELGTGNFELALVDGDVLRQVQGRLDEAFGRLFQKGEDMYFKKLPEISREQFCGRMADMLKSRHDQDIKPLMDVFKEYEIQIASLVSQNIYGEYCVWTGTIVEILNEFIGSHPEIFMPSSISKPIDEPDIIRCFVNDETMLIMDYEFELAKTQNRKLAYYELKDLKEMREKIIKTGVYATVMSHKFGTYFLKNAEFVRMSMIQTFRRAVPIPTFDGRHCILASDLLMEIFRDMCSVQNVFQKINQNNWSIVEDCFNDLAGTFNERLGPFFIDTEKSESVRKQCEDYFEKHLGSSRVDMINEVPETGFTLKDVEQNVKYLGLENAFPNIMKFADYAYTIMKKLAGNRTLETSDMLTVLEFCQVNCILPKLPKIERFIHNQGACRRVFYQCSYCLPIMPRALGNPKMRIWVRSRKQEMSKSYFAPNTEDVEQINRNPEAEKGSSDKRESSEFPKDEKCENFEEFEEELQELIRYYAYEKERTSSKWGKNNRILEKSMKNFGLHELSEENRELFNKQFDRIMNRSDWDIKNCQPDDEGRPWPWFTHKEH
ncbi:hypothetical protein L5515_006676 [Caenorhabditis briggsae]|uniref:DUF7809 domain-containing protein n=2 Tax=Caenorhabditis briggsae TaxID=6238 RepID=A0AAE9F501_CAEBR|nr:hypothetical protein L5515_006676 [Caenorhabditis briggsae]